LPTVNPQVERSKTARKRTTYLVNARGYAMRPGENGSPILAPNAQFLARNEISAKESQSVVYSPFRRVGIVFVLFVGVRAEETDEDGQDGPRERSSDQCTVLPGWPHAPLVGLLRRFRSPSVVVVWLLVVPWWSVPYLVGWLDPCGRWTCMQRPCVRLVECRAVAVACRMGSGWTVGVDWGGFWEEKKRKERAAINGVD
jgi:hypothetical protein